MKYNFNKYNFNNGIITINKKNNYDHLKAYMDKFFTKFGDTEVWTSKKSFKNDEKLKKNICPICGNLSNYFTKNYFEIYGTVSSYIHCPLCYSLPLGYDYDIIKDLRLLKYHHLKKRNKMYLKYLKEKEPKRYKETKNSVKRMKMKKENAVFLKHLNDFLNDGKKEEKVKNK